MHGGQGGDALRDVLDHKDSPRKHRALLADDNPVNLKVSTAQLNRLNWDVDVVSSGTEVVKRFKAAPPDTYQVVLVDVHMPGMSGIEAALEIRQFEKQPRRPGFIVALTADTTLDEAARAGFNDCLTKPVSLQQLEGVLKRALDAGMS